MLIFICWLIALTSLPIVILYVVARMLHLRVNKVQFGFAPGFHLYQGRISETEVTVGWVPVSGNFAIAGLLEEDGRESLPEELSSRPLLQRLLVSSLISLSMIVIGLLCWALRSDRR